MKGLLPRWLVGFHIGLVILLGLWISVGGWVAERHWANVIPPAAQAVTQQFPARDSDQSAQTLQALVQPLGLELIEPRIAQEIVTQSPATEPPIGAETWLNILHDSTDQTVLPNELITYLKEHSTELTAIIAHLVNEPLPQWVRPSWPELLQINAANTVLTDSPVKAGVNYPAFITLQRLILLTGVMGAQQDEPQVARDSLTAAWNLLLSLADQPFGFSPTMLREQGAALRQFHLELTDWRKRWQTANPIYLGAQPTAWPVLQAEFLKSLAGHLGCQPSQTKCESAAGLRLLFRSVMQPYLTFAAIDLFHRASHTPLSSACLPPADINPQAWLEGEKTLRWNEATYTYLQLTARLERSNYLNWELTDKVLQLRDLIAQTGQLPTTVPGLGKSSVCPSLQWTYQVTATDQGTLAIQSPLSYVHYVLHTRPQS